MMTGTVDELVEDYGTSEPFALAEKMDICVHCHDLGSVNGYYLIYKGRKNIIVNSRLPKHIQRFVLAHEIGHSIMHSNANAFLLSHTFYPTDRQEVEADRFAIALLLSDSMIRDNPDRTVDDWASILGLPRKVIELKFRG